MKIIFNILIAVMLVVILAGAVWRTQTDRDETQQIEQTRREVQRFEQIIALRAALKDVELSERGYPLTIDPAWFDNILPKNLLLDDARPWLEIEDAEGRDLWDPPDPIAYVREQAAFWYNPYTGMLRARVPEQTSEVAGIELYNRINGTSLRPM